MCTQILYIHGTFKDISKIFKYAYTIDFICYLLRCFIFFAVSRISKCTLVSVSVSMRSINSLDP